MTCFLTGCEKGGRGSGQIWVSGFQLEPCLGYGRAIYWLSYAKGGRFEGIATAQFQSHWVWASTTSKWSYRLYVWSFQPSSRLEFSTRQCVSLWVVWKAMEWCDSSTVTKRSWTGASFWVNEFRSVDGIKLLGHRPWFRRSNWSLNNESSQESGTVSCFCRGAPLQGSHVWERERLKPERDLLLWTNQEGDNHTDDGIYE